jgi:hypothetical protein
MIGIKEKQKTYMHDTDDVMSGRPRGGVGTYERVYPVQTPARREKVSAGDRIVSSTKNVLEKRLSALN